MKKLLIFPILFLLSCSTEPEPIYGCTDSTSCNFNSQANTDDGSCGYHLGECGVCDNDSTNDCTVMDNEGNIYNVVRMGVAELGYSYWMAENLRVRHFNNGNEISIPYNSNFWSSGEGYYYGVYNDNSSYASSYGYLYDLEVMEIEDDNLWGGLCPEGFHIPSYNEWNDLFMPYTDEGSQLIGKFMDAYEAFETPTSEQLQIYTNETGLNLQLGGWKKTDGSYDRMGESGYYWLDDSYGQNGIDKGQYYLEFRNNYTDKETFLGYGLGVSIRCMKY